MLSDQLTGEAGDLSTRADVVASTATQMSAGIGEIARSAAEAAQDTSAAVGAAHSVRSRVNELDGSSTKIGSVTQLIKSIADQTKLLALNATIEAARAGEAGRGFAIVANEVKELAAETSRATAEIGPVIADMQAASSAVASAMHEILSLVEHVEAQQTTIASAVEEQGAASNEMSSSIHGVAGSTQTVATAAELLRQTAQDVSSKAEQVAARAAGPNGPVIARGGRSLTGP